jgi:hypothetical protein
MRQAVVLVALAALFSRGLEAQTKATSKASPSKRAPDAKYEAAREALQEMDSAASVGLDFRQFNERVINVKIRVDKLGNNPRYRLMKETTQLLIDTSTLWNGSIAGRLPTGSMQALKERYANDTDLQEGLSGMGWDEPGGADLQKEEWKIAARYAYSVLWRRAQHSMAEALGKSPKGGP